MFAILGWFTYMQFFGADERRLNVNSDSMVYLLMVVNEIQQYLYYHHHFQYRRLH